MARNQFIRRARFQILNEQRVWVWHEIDEVLADNKFSLTNIQEGGRFVETKENLMNLYLNEKIKFETKGKTAYKRPNEQLSYEKNYGDFSAIPEKYRAETLRRYELIIPILRLGHSVSNEFLDDYVEKLLKDPKYRNQQNLPSTGKKGREGKPLGSALSRTSIRLWISVYEQSGYSLDSLSPYAKPAEVTTEHRLQDEVEDAILNVLKTHNANLQSNPPSFHKVDEITEDVIDVIDNLNLSQPVGKKLSYPHPNTIRNRIKEYGLENLIRTRKKRGEALDESNPVHEGERATRINEIHEYDGTQLKLIVIDDNDGFPVGLASFMGGIDNLTGYPTGWRIAYEPPSYKLVADTLITSILPKPDFVSLYGTQNNCLSYGLPEIAKFDNGNEWVNQSMITACGEQGIIFLQCPTYSPNLKGGIERYIETTGANFITRVNGATFNYMFNTRDYNPVDYSCISLSVINYLANTYVVDIYAKTTQEGRKGSPATLWQENISKGFLPCLPDSVQSLRLSFYRSEMRKLQRYGIELDTIIYQAKDTARLRSLLKNEEREVLVKRNPYDISYIYILDPVTKREWLPFYANNQEYTKGLSIWKHKVIREYLLQVMALELNIINLNKAKKHVREVVEKEYQKVKSLRKGRRKGAAYLYESDPNRFIELPYGLPIKKSEATVLLPHTDIYDYTYNTEAESGDSRKTEQSTQPKKGSSPKPKKSTSNETTSNIPNPPKKNPEMPLKSNDDDNDNEMLENWGGRYRT